MRNLFSLIGLFLALVVQAQDPQFSQYYAAPLLLNPALTGGGECYRVGFNGRTQWTGLPSAYNTIAVFGDLNYEDLRSGFGVYALHDEMGTAKLSTNEFSALYRYQVSFSKKVNFRFGLQASYVSRTINYSTLTFEDQYAGTVLTGVASADRVIDFNKTQYFDFSSGILMYDEDNYWLGISAYHLNRPNQGFMDESNIPIKLSVHGGYNFYTHKRFRDQIQWRITPTFLYKAQAKFDQLDLGIYFIREKLLAGIWYRGIPVKKDENIHSSDAIVFQGGLKLHSFSVVYSYDFTVSKLEFRNTKGSHELSIIYNFCLDWPPKKKPARSVRRLPCPSFNRR